MVVLQLGWPFVVPLIDRRDALHLASFESGAAGPGGLATAAAIFSALPDDPYARAEIGFVKAS